MTEQSPEGLADSIESKMRARQACKTEAAADAFTHEIGLIVCGHPETILTALRDHTGAGDALRSAGDDLAHAARSEWDTASRASPRLTEALAAWDHLSRTPDPLSELQRLGQECDRDEGHSWLHRHDPPDREPFDRKAVLEEAARVAESCQEANRFVTNEVANRIAKRIRALSKDGEQDLCAEIAQKSGEGGHG